MNKQNKYDAGDEPQVRERKTKAQLKKEAKLANLERFLQDKAFRDWVWELISYTKVFNTHAHLEPHEMAIAAGRRDVGLKIFGDVLEADPKAYAIMTEENENVR